MPGLVGWQQVAGMRRARIKVAAADGEAVYHVMTRTVNGEFLIDDVGKEVLRKQLWQVADYCGVQILTYALLSNHFHVLLRVPHLTEIPTDAELLRRYAILYPKPTRYQMARLEVIKAQLKSNGPEAQASVNDRLNVSFSDNVKVPEKIYGMEKKQYSWGGVQG